MGERVESYSGYMSPERPRVFVWQGERIEVVEILARGRLPGEWWFRVRSGGGEIFDLVYTITTDEWHVQNRSFE
jgi:hypothetical protein